MTKSLLKALLWILLAAVAAGGFYYYRSSRLAKKAAQLPPPSPLTGDVKQLKEQQKARLEKLINNMNTETNRLTQRSLAANQRMTAAPANPTANIQRTLQTLDEINRINRINQQSRQRQQPPK